MLISRKKLPENANGCSTRSIRLFAGDCNTNMAREIAPSGVGPKGAMAAIDSTEECGVPSGIARAMPKRVALAASLAFLLIGARWIWLYRQPGLLDTDEAGFLATALSDYLALMAHGVGSWIATTWQPNYQSPFVPAVTSLLFVVVGKHPMAGLLIPVLCASLTVYLSFEIGRRATGSAIQGVLIAALVASCPVIVNYSRTFVFALPAALVFSLAMWSLLKTDRFENWKWSVLLGVCVGLLALTRTVTMAFIPGIGLAAVIYVAADRKSSLRRACFFALSVVVAIAVAMTWLAFNGKYAVTYLVGWGYGSFSARMGTTGFSVLILLRRLWDNINSSLFLPHGLIFVFGLLSYIAMLAVRRWKLRSAAIQTAASPLLPIAIIGLSGLAALITSNNMGTGFMAPLVPALMTTAVCGLSGLFGVRLATVLTSAAALVSAAPAIAPAGRVNITTGLAQKLISVLKCAFVCRTY
jgi:4-amino-4-deoxy-L-arabinose transferase-like glycosyltransferase